MATLKPTRYMKKPTYVEAMLVAPSTINDVAKWVGGSVSDDLHYGKQVILPKTKAPHNRARMGMYVVKYVNGDLSTAEPDSFDEVYVPA